LLLEEERFGNGLCEGNPQTSSPSCRHPFG
jgi:hypothetical protein